METEKNTTKNENKTTLRVTNRPPYRMVRVRSLLISTVVPIYFQSVQLHKLPSLPTTKPQLNHQKNGRHSRSHNKIQFRCRLFIPICSACTTWSRYHDKDTLGYSPVLTLQHHGLRWDLQSGPKKRGPQTHDHNSSNLNRFLKTFTGRFLGKFAVKWILEIPPHLACVATQSFETLMSAN